MTDGMYDTIRTYLAEIASNQRQLLKGQERPNALLAALVEQSKPVELTTVLDSAPEKLQTKRGTKKAA